MRRISLSALFLVAMSALGAFPQSQVQPRADVSQKTPQKKEVSSLSTKVGELSRNVQNLETMTANLQKRLAELEQRQAAGEALKNSKAGQLSRIRSELVSGGCEGDQNRAVAMASASGLPTTTYEGAAAMNCVERLRKVVQKVVQTLEDQE